MNLQGDQEALTEVVAWIDQRFAGITLPGDERSRIVVGCFDVALEHQAAIALLSSGQLYGSMFSLLRIITEAVVRGLWLGQCAADFEIKRFKHHRIDKDFGELIQDIESAIGYMDSPLSKLKTNSWRFMNGFTHTGFHQVLRRNSELATGPNYPEQEISQALALTASLGLIAAAQLASIASLPHLVHDTIQKMREFAAARSNKSFKPNPLRGSA